MQATVWRTERQYRTFRWQRWWLLGSWLFGASHCSGRPQPFHLVERLNLYPFFHPSSLIDLIYLDSSEDDDDSDEEITIHRETAKMPIVKKCSCLSFLYATSADPVFLNCVHFLSSCTHHPPCYINSYGKNCFDICWPQLLHLRDWISDINLLVWASFQPPSEWLRFHCRHFPQMYQDQSRVKDGKTA